MGKTYLILSVNSISSTNATSCRSRGTARAIVAPICTTLSVGTISSHVTSVAADTANDVGGEVTLLRTVVLAVTNLTTVLASLVLVVSKGSVESGELTQLVALEFVLAFGYGCSLMQSVSDQRWVGKEKTYGLNYIVDQLLRLVDLLLGIRHDQAMKIFFLIAGVSCIGTTLSFLDGPFSTNGNLGA
jgi:hypothetical protein